MRRCHTNVHPQTQHRWQWERHRYCSSSTNAAVILFSSCFLLWAHHSVTVSGFLPANNIPRAIIAIRSASHYSPSKASNTVEDIMCNEDNGSSKKSRYSKRHQLRQKQQQRNNNSNQRYHQTNPSEVDQVHAWLLQSTSLILGEELTLELVNGGVDTGFTSPGRINKECNNQQKLTSHFSSDREFILNAESVMRAWCRWISRCSNGGGSVNLSLDDDAIRCTVINAAKVVDAILNRVIVIDERRACEGGEEDTMGVVEWETKLVELTNVAIGIDAWTNSKNSCEGVSRAEGWLHFLQRRLGGDDISSKGYDSRLSDNVLKLYEESYRGVIKACIRGRERKYLGKAIGLLEDLRVQHQNPSLPDSSQARLYPATQTYNLVLYGLATVNLAWKMRNELKQNAERAETILHEMIAFQQRGAHYVCGPDSNTFRQVVTAWTKSGSNVAAENARRIFDRMISQFPVLNPDISTFNALMTLYLKLGKTEEALALFDLINSMHESGRSDITPDVYSVNLMLKAMTKRPPHSLEDMEAVEEVLENLSQPDKQSYNIVLDAWGKSQLREAATRAESLLDCMERKCRHDPNVAPDGYSFTSTINAIERSRHHTERGSWAEKVFRRMKEMHSQGLVEEPTTPVYNALINTLISSEESGSLERAEALFLEMQTANLTNTRTFNTMIKCYAMFERSRGDGEIASFSRPRKAERLLDEMEISYYSKGMTTAISPDKYSYTTVISAYGRSNTQRKAAKAYAILQRMIDSYQEGNSAAKPGTFAFNAVLNACAHTRFPEERLEAFTILCSTLILQRDWAKPDHTTYGTFFQACSRLLPTDETRKWRVVEAVFNSCVKEGQCGQMVVRNLKNVASPELYDAMVGRFLTDDGL
eukprot:CAMPEP_0201946168 /NCGR_PEP_ID=MMETSP0903-20130614/54282_1 /ASSEMBLY_ACC=CAM_ASM_000552 /TAXON_ID=420261 /ORGANISM="Thalassiosira antarctica, Strain CCMP982" /LENGTH=874 /DNA_ID=CAMNT_0048489261 /DNA_START=64 /DNA_END=2686 /DNA_ORIENTATION=-